MEVAGPLGTPLGLAQRKRALNKQKEAKFHHSPFSKEHEQFARAAKHQGSAGKEGGVVGA